MVPKLSNQLSKEAGLAINSYGGVLYSYNFI
nr:MAG TPA: hypothetical protein [Bacteriophage sp.]